MKWRWLRPFLFFFVGLIGLLLVLIWRAPPGLVTAVFPLVNAADLPIDGPFKQDADVVPGRTTWLFVLKTEVGPGAEGVIVQYLHWYPDEAVAQENWQLHKDGSPDIFPGQTQQYLVPLDEPVQQSVLLCTETENGRQLCEYRAYHTHWTLHVDFVSRQKEALSIADMTSSATAMGRKLMNHE